MSKYYDHFQPSIDAFERERRDAWVRFAAERSSGSYGEHGQAHGFSALLLPKDCASFADLLLAEFDARFGKEEEG